MKRTLPLLALLACVDPSVVGHAMQSVTTGESLWLDPIDYGVELDNDCATATDNATDLQSAADDGPVRLPIGELCIDGIVSLTHSMEGLGHASILKAHSPAASEKFVSVDAQSGLVLANFKIEANGDSAAAGEHAHAIWIHSSTDIAVSGVWVDKPQGDAIAVHSDSGGWSDRITIRDNYATNRGRASISITGYGAHNVTIIGNRAEKGTQATSTTVSQGACIGLEPSVASDDPLNTIIRANTCDGSIVVTHQDGAHWDGLAIVENTMDVGGVELHRAQGFHVDRNTITGDGTTDHTGILIQEHGATEATGDGTVSGNVIRNVDGDGIAISKSSSADYILGPIEVASNVIADVTGDGVVLYAAMSGLSVVTNIIRDTGGTGVSLLDASEFRISGNSLSETGTFGIFVNSASGGTHGPGVVSSNAVNYASSTGKTGMRLSSSGSGTATRIFVTLNDFASSASVGTAVHNQGSADYCYGVGNIKSGTSAPVDDTY